MEPEYDVFEVLLDRTVKWHFCVREKQRALDMLKALGSRTFNECFATNLQTQQIISRVNLGGFAAQSIIEIIELRQVNSAGVFEGVPDHGSLCCESGRDCIPPESAPTQQINFLEQSQDFR